jgi:tetratricopeptide (TPR) repeat protein
MQKQQPTPLSAELRAQARNTATRGNSRARRVGMADIFSNPTFEPVVKGGFVLLLLIGVLFAYLVISSLVQDDETEWAVGWAHSFILDTIEKDPTVSFSTTRTEQQDDAPLWTVGGTIRMQRADDTVTVVPYEAVIRRTCDVNARSACWSLKELRLSDEPVDLSQLEFATLRFSDDSGQWIYDRSKFLESARSRAEDFARRGSESTGPTPQETALANVRARSQPSAAEAARQRAQQAPPPAPAQAEAEQPGPIPAPPALSTDAPAPTQAGATMQPEEPQPAPAETPAPEAETAAAEPTVPPDAPAEATPPASPAAATADAEPTQSGAMQAATEPAMPAPAAEPVPPEPTTVAAIPAAPTDDVPAQPASMPADAADSDPVVAESAADATPEPAEPETISAETSEDVAVPEHAAETTTMAATDAADAAETMVVADAETEAPAVPVAEAPAVAAPVDDLQSVRAALEQALAEAERPIGAPAPAQTPAPMAPDAAAESVAAEVTTDATMAESSAATPEGVTSGMPDSGLDTLARVLGVPSGEPTLPPPPPRDDPGAAAPLATPPATETQPPAAATEPLPAEAPEVAPADTQIAALPPAETASEPTVAPEEPDTFEAEVLPDGTRLDAGGALPSESRPQPEPEPGPVAAARFGPVQDAPGGPPSVSGRSSLPDRETLVFLIQSYLSDAGYDPGPLDGLLGPRTQVAIGQYQTDNGLPSNNQPSEALLQHLEARFLTPREVDAPGRPGGTTSGGRPPAGNRLVANYAPEGMVLGPPSVDGPATPRGPQINRTQDAAGAAVGPRRYYRVGLPSEAPTTNANAPAATPSDAGIQDAAGMLRLAREAASRDEHNLAIGHYTRAQRAPGISRALVAEALAGRGRSYAAIGLYEKARADLTRSIDAAPDIATTYFDRGRIYEAIGDTENAVRDYTRAYRLAPNDARIAGKARELGLAQAGAPTVITPAN